MHTVTHAQLAVAQLCGQNSQATMWASALACCMPRMLPWTPSYPVRLPQQRGAAKVPLAPPAETAWCSEPHVRSVSLRHIMWLLGRAKMASGVATGVLDEWIHLHQQANGRSEACDGRLMAGRKRAMAG